jgi:predicted regulator of Ras-like GTPase activity (Roadblock/LC7/MglB family)
MEQILEELNNISGVLCSMIIGKDGLVISSIWNQDVEADMVGAHSADLLNLSESFTEEKLNYGTIDMITLEAENAKFFLKNVDSATLMAVATSSNVNLGLIRMEIRAACEKLKEIL